MNKIIQKGDNVLTPLSPQGDNSPKEGIRGVKKKD
jgi:hypothetical protein